jgi:hypothetical protein
MALFLPLTDEHDVLRHQIRPKPIGTVVRRYSYIAGRHRFSDEKTVASERGPGALLYLRTVW